MRTRNIGPFLGALLVLLAVIILGDWDQGLSGLTPLAVAQDAADRDEDRDNKKKDHFACYEVRCIDKWGHKVECPKVREEVILFNQFTERDRDDKKDDRDDKKDGLKVFVERLRLLCVPTHKQHQDDHRPD